MANLFQPTKKEKAELEVFLIFFFIHSSNKIINFLKTGLQSIKIEHVILYQRRGHGLCTFASAGKLLL